VADMNELDAAGIDIVGLVRRFGDVEAVADITLHVQAGSFTTLLGPSGCGKSTTLRMIAGLDRPDSGSISIGGRLVSGAGVHVRPQDRRVGFVFQSYALWPHMTVAAHVAYALRARGAPRAGIQDRVRDTLALVGLDMVPERYPYELSGGQQQRVAVARALATEPQVLLLDEPLSNLDAELRAQMRQELRRVHDHTGVTTILVTHDQAEALSLSDTVVVMDRGKIVDFGEPHDIYERPGRLSTAMFVGASNILPGIVVETGGVGSKTIVEIDADAAISVTAIGSPDTARTNTRVAVVIKPEDIDVSATDVIAVGNNEIPCLITNCVYYGSHTLLTLRALGGGDVELRAWTAKSVRASVGDEVVARLPSDRIVVLPAETQRTLADDQTSSRGGPVADRTTTS
jgi:ABC-type Fe3+/spermidine/putrescine transport system ATPase subunit